MNKKLLLTALAGIIFSACSQDTPVEVRQSNEIGFRHNLIRTTRGTETTLDNIGSFFVATPDQPTYFPGNYATKKSGSASGSSDTWVADNAPVRWRGDALNVYAYGPASSSDNIYKEKVTLTSSEKKIKGFTPVNAIKDQKDLVVATNLNVRESDTSNGIIPLFFNHELAQIKIQAKSEYTNYKVEVAGVKLVHFNTTGDYTFPDATSSTSKQGTWSGQTGVPRTPTNERTNVDGYYAQLEGAKIKDSSVSPLTLTSKPTSILLNGGDAGAFFVPQSITGWNREQVETNTGAQIAVLLRISKNTATTGTTANWQQIYPDPSIDGNATKFAYAAVGVTANFEAGKVYTIILDILSPNAGAGAPPKNPYTPDPDKPTNDDTVTDKPGVTPGTPIISDKVIEFGVQIDVFDPAEDISVNM